MKQGIIFILVFIMISNAVNAFVICDMPHQMLDEVSSDMPCYGDDKSDEVTPTAHFCDCDNCVQPFYSLSPLPSLPILHSERSADLNHQHINPDKHNRLRPPIHHSI